MNGLPIISEPGLYIFRCPHCGIMISVTEKEKNCQKFVCGIYRNGGQVNPHISESEAYALKKNHNVIGCLRPFYFDGHVLTKRNYG